MVNLAWASDQFAEYILIHPEITQLHKVFNAFQRELYYKYGQLLSDEECIILLKCGRAVKKCPKEVANALFRANCVNCLRL